jgi:hypothetical protein
MEPVPHPSVHDIPAQHPAGVVEALDPTDRLWVTAELTTLYPLGYSGYAGVSNSGVQSGSATVAGLPSVSARLTAVTGRQ